MTTPRPQDTDPLRAKGTDREPERRRRYVPMPWDFDAMSPEAFDGYIERIGFGARIRAALAEPYSGWSAPRPWYRRLAAWVRKWRRP